MSIVYDLLSIEVVPSLTHSLLLKNIQIAGGFVCMVLVVVVFMLKTVLLPQLVLNSSMDDSHIHNINMYPGVVHCSLFSISYTLMSKRV